MKFTENKILILLIIAYLALSAFQLIYDRENFSIFGDIGFFIGGFIASAFYILYKKGFSK